MYNKTSLLQINFSQDWLKSSPKISDKTFAPKLVWYRRPWLQNIQTALCSLLSSRQTCCETHLHAKLSDWCLRVGLPLAFSEPEEGIVVSFYPYRSLVLQSGDWRRVPNSFQDLTPGDYLRWTETSNYQGSLWGGGLYAGVNDVC